MKNKIILAILILSMITLIFSGCDGGNLVIPPIPDNGEISDYFRLDVPYIEQNSDNLCLPSSTAMILKYYEDPRDIVEIRDKLALPWQEDGIGGIMVLDNNGNLVGDVDKLFDYVKSLGFSTKKEYGLTIEEIKDKLKEGFPIIVLQDFYLDSYKKYDGHFSVIVGYREIGDNDEENKLIINDPWSRRGQYWEVTYSDFKIRNSNWWKENHDLNSDLAHSYIIWKDTPIIPVSIINVALGKPVSVTTNGADEPHEHVGEWPSDITDGSLDYQPVSSGIEDGCVAWVNDDYNELMVVTVTIDLQGTYSISKIRYNMGNCQRAETWNVDIMESPFGRIPTNPGTPYSGAWTEQTGNISASSVTIKFEKTRTAWERNWLFIGEIEVWGTPVGNPV